MGRKEEFDWLDDPFNEKKAKEDQANASMAGGTKVALGCGCLLVVIVIIVLVVFFGMNMMGILADM